MRELERAITQSVAGTDMSGTPIEFSWA
jgi:hypothetical protein